MTRTHWQVLSLPPPPSRGGSALPEDLQEVWRKAGVSSELQRGLLSRPLPQDSDLAGDLEVAWVPFGLPCLSRQVT